MADQTPYRYEHDHMIFDQLLGSHDGTIRFDEVYQAEMLLRHDIIQALILENSEEHRSEYLVQKELVNEASAAFIGSLHSHISGRLEESLRLHKKRHEDVMADVRSLKQEIEVAGRLQDKTIQRDFPTTTQAHFALWYQPHMLVGGDYYRVVHLPDGRYLLFLADITGHGIGAAMYYNTVHLVFERHMEQTCRPAEIISRMNADLYGKLGDSFVTALAVLVDLAAGKMEYANAAHTMGFFYDYKKGEAAQAKFLRPNGKVIGIFPPKDFRSDWLDFDDDIRLVMFTDGITEAINERNELWGDRRLIESLENTHGRPPEEAVGEVQRQLAAYQAGVAKMVHFKKTAPQEDDMTLLMAQFVYSGPR